MQASCPPRCPSCGQSYQVRRIGDVFERWPRSRALAARYAHLDQLPPRPLSPWRRCSCGCLVVNVLTLSVVLLTVPAINAFVHLGYADRTLLLVPLVLALGPLLLGLTQALRRRQSWRRRRLWATEQAQWRANWYCWPCDTAFLPLPPLPDGSYTGQTIHIGQ